MKNVYVFCSFAVLMLGLMISVYLLHTQINTLEQEISDVAQLQKQVLSQQDLYKELVKGNQEAAADPHQKTEKESETEQDVIRDAAASAHGQDETENVQESAQEQRHLTGYDITLMGSVLYVYAAGEKEPMITLPVSEGYLTESQRVLLEQGVHIEDMQEVYHLLESYSS